MLYSLCICDGIGRIIRGDTRLELCPQSALGAEVARAGFQALIQKDKVRVIGVEFGGPSKRFVLFHLFIGQLAPCCCRLHSLSSIDEMLISRKYPQRRNPYEGR